MNFFTPLMIFITRSLGYSEHSWGLMAYWLIVWCNTWWCIAPFLNPPGFAHGIGCIQILGIFTVPKAIHIYWGSSRFPRHWAKRFWASLHVPGLLMPCHIPYFWDLILFTHLEACVTLLEGTSTLEDALLTHEGFYWAYLTLPWLELATPWRLHTWLLELVLSGHPPLRVLPMILEDFSTLETYTSTLEETWESLFAWFVEIGWRHPFGGLSGLNIAL
jgi:hypothetical protein